MRFKFRRPRSRWVTALIGILAVIVVGAMASALWAFIVLPSHPPAVTQLEDFRPLEGTKVYDDNDELITELHEERRIFVPLAQIPKPVQQAILAMEDARC